MEEALFHRTELLFGSDGMNKIAEKSTSESWCVQCNIDNFKVISTLLTFILCFGKLLLLVVL